MRTGTVNHFADGSRTTLLVSDGEETVDFCYSAAKIASYERTNAAIRVTLTPIEIQFGSGLEATIETMYEFVGEGKLLIRRKIAHISDTNAKLHIQEYFKGCYGFTEYPEDMHGIALEAAGEGHGNEALLFNYASRSIRVESGNRVSAAIPQIGTMVSHETVGQPAVSCAVDEGHLFSPYFTLKLNYLLSEIGKEVATCLTIRVI